MCAYFLDTVCPFSAFEASMKEKKKAFLDKTDAIPKKRTATPLCLRQSKKMLFKTHRSKSGTQKNNGREARIIRELQKLFNTIV